ncbi:MAG: OmpA family protein [Bacteroidales bacterium]|nr:OmpA family protein [Bacteroidales bacterium]
MKKVLAMVMIALTVVSCGSLTKTANGALIGSGSGAALGAAVGALIGKDGKSAAIGTAIGTVVGAGVGTLIGNKMDKKAEELAALENAQVETVEDANGLKAVKVTFDSGILFKTNSSTLSADSKAALKDFAQKMSDMVETDITVYGHTDNTGSDAVNEKLSAQRANSVSTYLQSLGIDKSRIVSEGKSYSMPVATNETAEGRAQNRRVEIYISANENMIKQAENGTLQ